MAKAFIYDSIDLFNATLTDGTISGTDFAPSASLTNEERTIDQSISTAVTSWAADDMLRFDLGAASGFTPDIMAFYFLAATTDDVTVYAGTHATDLTVSTVKATITATFAAGWNVKTFDASPGDVRYYFLLAGAGGIDGLTEVMIGKKYDFALNYDMGASFKEGWGVDVIESYGGNEYVNKRREPKTVWSATWGNISSTMRTSLEAMRDACGGPLKKFLYYDETSYHWVRMTEDSLNFTEVSNGRYSTNITLIEQLS